jgi:hypothetical protein
MRLCAALLCEDREEVADIGEPDALLDTTIGLDSNVTGLMTGYTSQYRAGRDSATDTDDALTSSKSNSGKLSLAASVT